MIARDCKPIRCAGPLAGVDSPYRNRAHAGRLLAGMIAELSQPESYVIAVSPGGIQVAAAIAGRYWVPIDVAIAWPMDPPWPKAPPFGAIAFDGTAELDPELVAEYRIDRSRLARAVELGFARAAARSEALRGDRPFPDLSHRIAIMVDDGLTDAIVLRAVIAAVKNAGAAWTVLALPTGRRHIARQLSCSVDRIYCAHLRSDCHRPLADAYEQIEPLEDDLLSELLGAVSPLEPMFDDTAADYACMNLNR